MKKQLTDFLRKNEIFPEESTKVNFLIIVYGRNF